SMWSRKPMPVATSARPEPSRFTFTVISVSLVERAILPSRIGKHPGAARSSSNATLTPPPRTRKSGYGLRRRNEALYGRREFSMRDEPQTFHGTTIVSVRKGNKVAIGGDGQVSMGNTIVKANARKVRRLGDGDVIGGFAGATADALTLFDRLEQKLEQHRGQLARACVELAK